MKSLCLQYFAVTLHIFIAIQSHVEDMVSQKYDGNGKLDFNPMLYFYLDQQRIDREQLTTFYSIATNHINFNYAICKSHTSHEFIESLRYIDATLNTIEIKETFSFPLTTKRNIT